MITANERSITISRIQAHQVNYCEYEFDNESRMKEGGRGGEADIERRGEIYSRLEIRESEVVGMNRTRENFFFLPFIADESHDVICCRRHDFNES